MKYRAIVVDDELHGRENLSYMVKNYFNDVSVVAEASNLSEAREQINLTDPHIIFLDLHIEDEFGFDLIDDLTAKKYAVIVVSGHADYGISAVKKGVVDYVLKPVSIEDLEAALDKARSFIDDYTMMQDISRDKKLSEDLLSRMLPGDTLSELIGKGKVEPRVFSDVSVLFADFKGFTYIAERMQPIDLITRLDLFFNRFDEIVQQYSLDKIKTMGDGYLCAGGISPAANGNTLQNIANAALEMQKFVRQVQAQKKDHDNAWELRIGIHTGEVVGGVVGKSKLAYDIWGDTVNYANRLQSICEPGRIVISGQSARLLKDQFKITYGGKLPGKNNEEFEVYYIDN